MTCAFVATHKIDSYLKLRVLLSLHLEDQRSLSLDELGEQFFLADQRGLEQLLAELCQHGLLICDGVSWRKNDQPDIASCLCCLTHTFDDPWARQRLLNQIAGRDADPVN